MPEPVDGKREVTWADEVGKGNLFRTTLIPQMVYRYEMDPKAKLPYHPQYSQERKLAKEGIRRISSALIKAQFMLANY